MARTGSSPGFGPRVLAFPTAVSGVVWARVLLCPLQWRGRAGISPASVSPFALNCEPNLRCGVLRGKHGRQLRLECGAVSDVVRLDQRNISPLVPRVERRDGRDQ